MLFVEEEAVFSPEDTGASGATDEISDSVSAACGSEEQRRQRVYVEESLGGKESGPLDQIRQVGNAVEKVGQCLHDGWLAENGAETWKFIAPATQSNSC